MIGMLCFVLAVLASPFKSKLRLEAENAVLRRQLIVLRRRLHGRVRLTHHDRWFFIQLCGWLYVRDAVRVVRSPSDRQLRDRGCRPECTRTWRAREGAGHSGI